jgi:peptidoglycan/xylan/chitin deacetylase (PgdA/CDA1 family)
MTDKATITSRALKFAHGFGVFGILQRRLPPHLTVLVYHRIDNPERPAFHGDPDLVSASPDAFVRQLDYLIANYTPVDERALISWLDRKAELPDRPLLITFDDGYRDNLIEAASALKDRGIPTLLFVCTRFIAGELEFYWDWLADALQSIGERSQTLPLLGRVALSDAQSRRKVRRDFIARAKQMTERERVELIAATARALKVARPRRPSMDQHLHWPDLERLRELGFTIGGHTVSHSILSRLPDDEAAAEVQESCREIAARLRVPVKSFAYPNGMADDFTAVHEAAAVGCGVRLAFSANGRVSPFDEIRRRPLAISRIGIYQRDDVPRFAAKLAQIGRRY